MLFVTHMLSQLSMSGGSRWRCYPTGDFQKKISQEVFSSRCEEQEGDEVPQAEIGEHDSGRVRN